MFSGITNQVNSWMTKKQDENVSKGDTTNNDLPLSSKDEEIEGINKPDITSPTKSSRLEMLGSVKNQMTSWIGGGIAGLRKASASTEPSSVQKDATESSADYEVEEGSSKIKDDDDDNSSATGGADSEAVISDTEGDVAGGSFGVIAVSEKAMEGAKNVGIFLYDAVNSAGKKVTKAGARIKKTVEENSILGDFNKEQEAFIKDKEGKGNGTPVPPWAGCPNEEAVKELCLALSIDKRNFLKSPPPGVDFQFDYDVSYPVALAILAEDPNLEKMRFELVPKMVSEEKFWLNYFYRVSLICQENELNSMVQEQESNSGMNELSYQKKNKVESKLADDPIIRSTEQEKLSNAVKSLNINSKHDESEEEFEKALEAELQDYEVVNENETPNTQVLTDLNPKELDDLLDSADELSDLK